MSQEKNVTPLKPEELTFDGERFVPGAGVEITYHHWLRYFFALQLAQDKGVLDVACGEGYGAAYLTSVAESVDAFDLDQEAVSHARTVYGDNPRLHISRNDIAGFFKDAPAGAYALVTAVELIEPAEEKVQLELLNGIKRVLAPGGVAVISTPDKQLYSDMKLMKNPFHVREMYRDEFASLLSQVFPHTRMFEQFSYTGSAIFEPGAPKAELCEFVWTDQLRLKGQVRASARGGGEYLIAIVSKDPVPSPESAVMLDRARRLV